MTLKATSSPATPQLRELLEKAFEAGHWSWPTPDAPTRAIQRQKAVDELLATGAASPATPALQQLILDWRDNSTRAKANADNPHIATLDRRQCEGVYQAYEQCADELAAVFASLHQKDE